MIGTPVGRLLCKCFQCFLSQVGQGPGWAPVHKQRGLMLSAQCPAAGHLDGDLASAAMPPGEDEDASRPIHHHLGQHGFQRRVDRGRVQRLNPGHCPQTIQPCSEGHVEPSGRAGPQAAPAFLGQRPLLCLHLRNDG